MRNFRLDDESGHQEALFSWAAYRTEIMPELQYMYHVPNGGKRDKATAAVLKRQGVKAGVPDIMLPAARAGYHGLYIELKAGENTTTKKQKEWLEYLRQQGYYTAVCYGWQPAAQTLIMTAHIDKAVEEIERRREAAGRGVEYKAFEMYFMQGMDYAEIAEELDTGKNTPRRWVTGIINELSVLLWGIDEERVK